MKAIGVGIGIDLTKVIFPFYYLIILCIHFCFRSLFKFITQRDIMIKILNQKQLQSLLMELKDWIGGYFFNLFNLIKINNLFRFYYYNLDESHLVAIAYGPCYEALEEYQVMTWGEVQPSKSIYFEMSL